MKNNPLVKWARSTGVALYRLVRLPFTVLEMLERIDARLAEIERTSREVRRCVNPGENHRRLYCLRMGHWNDSEGRR